MFTTAPELFAAPGHLDPDACQRALGARDARFDGLFFVGITTTRVYCRPVCPARVSYPERRRFFVSPAAAEGAGFRPCLRCRPELAPGCALIDAIPRLAHVAAHRIAAGALNGRTVADLARDLGVSERHLRRALEREVGVSPLELAQTHRLLLAKRLLADTTLSVTRVAYASGFQSLRRFNAVFRERYRMPPTALRGGQRSTDARATRTVRPASEATTAASGELLRLTLAYRAPLTWEVLLPMLGERTIPGVEYNDGVRYGRTVRLDGRTGVVFVGAALPNGNRRRRVGNTYLTVEVSPSLLPVLMPILARLRHLFDLDAEPTVIDAHLAQSGLGAFVRRTPGLRMPGAFDGFEAALSLVLRRSVRGASALETIRRVVVALGEPADLPIGPLTHLIPSAERVAEAGAAALVRLGVPGARASAVATIARMVVDRRLSLEPGSDVDATHRVLTGIAGIDDRLATSIVASALQWPDAFSSSDRDGQRAIGVASARDLERRAEAWRPWRAYASLHLRLASQNDGR
ncbi:MAG: alkA 2 [Geminicoccaceae bacterium]|nr:alkA 2 [Geminicoccaceae bacterium]